LVWHGTSAPSQMASPASGAPWHVPYLPYPRYTSANYKAVHKWKLLYYVGKFSQLVDVDIIKSYVQRNSHLLHIVLFIFVLIILSCRPKVWHLLWG
jgi:hypothetical protein